MTELTAKRTEELLKSCLFTDEEVKDQDLLDRMVKVEGVVNQFGLHPDRLEKTRDQVVQLIDKLDAKFLAEGGGGYTFLSLPFDRDGKQWGEQRNAEQLYVLAAGLGLAKFALSRTYWSSLPGGVPYIIFSKEPVASLTNAMS